MEGKARHILKTCIYHFFAIVFEVTVHVLWSSPNSIEQYGQSVLQYLISLTLLVHMVHCAVKADLRE